MHIMPDIINEETNMNKNDIIETNNNMVDDFLEHHGIKGMKWGVRRYQNPDGSLTPEGQKRYNQFVSDVKQHGGKAGAINSVQKSAQNKKFAVGLATGLGLTGTGVAITAGAPILAAPIAIVGTVAVRSIANTIIANNAQKKIADIKDIKEIADQYVDRPNMDSRNDAYSESSNETYADGKTKREGDINAVKEQYYRDKAKYEQEFFDSTIKYDTTNMTEKEKEKKYSEYLKDRGAYLAKAAVNEYKKEHPATKLSDNEIAANLGYEL